MLGSAIRRWATNSGLVDPPGETRPFGSRLMGRALGAVGIAAAGFAVLWLAIPHDGHVDDLTMIVASLISAGLGAVLLSGRADQSPPAVFHMLLLTGYVLVSAGVYASSVPDQSLSLFYLWVIPFAYLGFAIGHALAHSVAMSLLYGLALIVQPDASNAAGVVPPVLFVLGTSLVVGLLVRGLARRMRSVDERFRTGFRESSTAMAMVAMDRRLLDVNDAYCTLVGRPREHLVGTNVGRLTHPDDLGETAPAIAAGGAIDSHLRVVRPGGEVIHVHVEAAMVRDEGEPYYFVLLHDETAQRAAEAHHHRQARQQAAISHLGRLALRELDLEALFATVAAVVHETLEADLVALSRYDPVRRRATIAAGIGFREHADLSMRVERGSLLEVCLAADAPVAYDLGDEEGPRPALTIRSHGAVAGIMAPVSRGEGAWGFVAAHSATPRRFLQDEAEFLGAVGNVLSAAVERFAGDQRMRHLALHDPLTGLPNRELAADRLDIALAARDRREGAVAVLMLDIDNFKVVNDSLGHVAGDQLLTTIAPRLAAAVRPMDTVGRIGGDEFLVVCDGADAPGVSALAERLLEAVRKPVTLDGGERFITASIGVAVADTAGADAEALIRDADAALYRAKERGRNRVELFDESLRRRALARFEVEADLRLALDRDELCVHYQPVVELETGRPVGVEALVRWEHPDRGLLLPADFVALAEETGLIVRLGQQVLGRACRDVARWQERFGAQLTLAVNVSGRQLADPDFTAQAASAAGSLGPGTLRLEVTETVLIGEGEAAVPVLADLHIHGISVVLDDFGTGYSSLAYLKRFNVDALKIDQVFVADMVRHEGDRAIVDAVLRMADSLGIDVVAEGIETAQQAEALQELGCRAGQGFHFSRPLDAESLERYLEQMLQPA